MITNERASERVDPEFKSSQGRDDMMVSAEAESDSAPSKSPEIEATVSDRETINDESDRLNVCLCCCVDTGKSRRYSCSCWG
jgi:hypothetical protein